MTALSKGRKTSARMGLEYMAPVAAATKIWQGAIVVLDASGNAAPATMATGLVAAGGAQATVDNSAGAAGDMTVVIEKGVFAYANSAAGDLITRAEIGDTAYLVDDQTVAKTDATGTRSAAGKIMDVDAEGVWIKFD